MCTLVLDPILIKKQIAYYQSDKIQYLQSLKTKDTIRVV